MRPFSFLEFFCGGGMARAGLGPSWECVLANDFDLRKSEVYKNNWGSETFHFGDIRKLKTANIDSRVDLAWASFPCQDLSLAGAGAGLKGERSGTFWPFWNLIRELCSSALSPRSIILENVTGAITSHNGKDFISLCETVSSQGYIFGAIVVDAALFLPHSRPRLFIVAFKDDVAIPDQIHSDGPSEIWHPRSLIHAQSKLSNSVKSRWRWWNIPAPSARNQSLIDVVEAKPAVRWHSLEETSLLVSKMSKGNRAKITAAVKSGRRSVGGGYRRTRFDENGNKVQRVEVRFDGVAGCLRTPAGGSSRQIIFDVERGKVRSRLISARETARLMGLSDDYILPENYNEAYHLTGDGVAVPVVRYIASQLIEPTIRAANATLTSAVA